MRSSLLLSLLSFSIVLVACGARSELDDTPARSPLCGNGVLDPGEECDPGSTSSDTSMKFTVTQNGETFGVQPLVEEQSATSFYDYVGASSHSGLEVANESRLYLYRDATTNVVSLVINHNIFGKSTGEASMHVSGLPRGFTVDRSDDEGELVATDATTADGDWSWDQYTDGGVIGGLCDGTAWAIVVTATFTEGISSWVWIDGDQSRKPLHTSQPVTIAPVPRCNSYCTLHTSCGSE